VVGATPLRSRKHYLNAGETGHYMNTTPLRRQELGDPKRLVAPADDVGRLRSLASSFSRTWDIEWQNIRYLAQELGSRSPGSIDRRIWHHLLMSVGNYKRQAGNITLYYKLGEPDTSAIDDAITIPVGNASVEVHKTDASTWSKLAEIKGLGGIPTGSTLLAALWPKEHFICDRRVLRAAIGLGPGSLWADDQLIHRELPEWDWEVYRWVWESLHLMVGDDLGLLEVERAIFQLDRRSEAYFPDEGDWTWPDYQKYASAGVQ